MPRADDIDRRNSLTLLRNSLCRPAAGTPSGNTAATQIVVDFARSDCRPCPARKQCTTSRRSARILTLQPRELHQAPTAARTEQKSETWQAKYALRAGIEGTIN
ncbi:transposase [Streptomyces sp. NPDC086080]|uniref:transposase n=1 Tax=Streptomyces sp. NPDC086080 TaxID=3365748 RepID=UPI0037D89DB5